MYLMEEASKKQIRDEVVSILFSYSRNNSEDFPAYMTAAAVQFFFRDAQEGISSEEQFKAIHYSHMYVQNLLSIRHEDESLVWAHRLIHELADRVIKRLKEKGAIGDDIGLVEEDELVVKHESDFDAWTKELSEEDKDK